MYSHSLTTDKFVSFCATKDNIKLKLYVGQLIVLGYLPNLPGIELFIRIDQAEIKTIKWSFSKL